MKKSDLNLVYEITKEMIYRICDGEINNNESIDTKHIQLNFDNNAKGAITILELLALEDSIRAYLKEFKEPFIEPNGQKVYEWQDDKDIRFRAIVDKAGKIFFCSNRKNERMKFKNPQVENYYESKLFSQISFM